MKFLLFGLLFLLLGATGPGQGGGGGGIPAGVDSVWSDGGGAVPALTAGATHTFDAGGGDYSRPAKRGLLAALPADCSEGDWYHATNSVASETYICIDGTANTWTLLPSATATGGATFTIDVDNAGLTPVDGAGIVIKGGATTGDITAAYNEVANGFSFNSAGLGYYSFDHMIVGPEASLQGPAPIITAYDDQMETPDSPSWTLGSDNDCDSTFYATNFFCNVKLTALLGDGVQQPIWTWNPDGEGSGAPAFMFHNGVVFEHHVVLPTAANPTANGPAGRFAHDSTFNQLVLGTGTVRRIFDWRNSESVNITTPYVHSYGGFKSRTPITVANIHCITDTGTATITVDECNADGTSCAGVDGATTISCTTTGGTDDTSLSNAGIDKDDWVRVNVTQISDPPPGDLAVTVYNNVVQE